MHSSAFYPYVFLQKRITNHCTQHLKTQQNANQIDSAHISTRRPIRSTKNRNALQFRIVCDRNKSVKFMNIIYIALRECMENEKWEWGTRGDRRWRYSRQYHTIIKHIIWADNAFTQFNVNAMIKRVTQTYFNASDNCNLQCQSS